MELLAQIECLYAEDRVFEELKLLVERKVAQINGLVE